MSAFQSIPVTNILALLGRSEWCAAAALPLVAQSADGPQWKHSGEYRPARWGQMKPAYALCDRGRRQSPIDIVATRPQPQPALQFQYRGAPLRVVNDGHTVRVRFASDSRMLMGAESLTLQQFHFHVPWGGACRARRSRWRCTWRPRAPFHWGVLSAFQVLP